VITEHFHARFGVRIVRRLESQLFNSCISKQSKTKHEKKRGGNGKNGT
jgi:hypothetical protein